MTTPSPGHVYASLCRPGGATAWAEQHLLAWLRGEPSLRGLQGCGWITAANSSHLREQLQPWDKRGGLPLGLNVIQDQALADPSHTSTRHARQLRQFFTSWPLPGPALWMIEGMDRWMQPLPPRSHVNRVAEPIRSLKRWCARQHLSVWGWVEVADPQDPRTWPRWTSHLDGVVSHHDGAHATVPSCVWHWDAPRTQADPPVWPAWPHLSVTEAWWSWRAPRMQGRVDAMDMVIDGRQLLDLSDTEGIPLHLVRLPRLGHVQPADVDAVFRPCNACVALTHTPQASYLLMLDHQLSAHFQVPAGHLFAGELHSAEPMLVHDGLDRLEREVLLGPHAAASPRLPTQPAPPQRMPRWRLLRSPTDQEPT